MSEYQYYEWQTIDRSLTGAERREVDGLSSHMVTVMSTLAKVAFQAYSVRNMAKAWPC